jgi:hypothetical protein
MSVASTEHRETLSPKVEPVPKNDRKRFQRLLIDKMAAPRVDKDGARLHRPEFDGPEERTPRARKSRMERNHICSLKQVRK